MVKLTQYITQTYIKLHRNIKTATTPVIPNVTEIKVALIITFPDAASETQKSGHVHGVIVNMY